MSVDIPAGLLAQADREKVFMDETVDNLVRCARSHLDEYGDSTKAFARLVASLTNGGAPHPASGIMAAAVVRLAQVTVE